MNDYFFDKDCPSYEQGSGTPEFWKSMYEKTLKQNKLFRKENQELIEALEFYAEPNNFKVDKNHGRNKYFIEEVIGAEGRDMGKRARQALENIRRGEG